MVTVSTYYKNVVVLLSLMWTTYVDDPPLISVMYVLNIYNFDYIARIILNLHVCAIDILKQYLFSFVLRNIGERQIEEETD